MTKIDLKDRRILYELDYNSRESLTQIGKKVGLKKDVVSYRIKKLQDEGVIQCFYTVIDAYKLGYTLFRYYIIFQYVNSEIRKKIIEYSIHCLTLTCALHIVSCLLKKRSPWRLHQVEIYNDFCTGHLH